MNKKKSAKIINLLLGINFILWGIIGFWSADTFSVIRVCITLLNILIGVLIIIRKTPISVKGFYENSVSIPAILLGGVLFKLAPDFDKWALFETYLFIGATLFTIYSFLYLGKSFSIRPALQSDIKTKGAYRIVRHPAYLGEYLMVLSCVIATSQWYTSFGALLLFVLQMIRIDGEEKVLSQSTDYQRYQENVQWKMIPFVW
ncbi:MAG: DUF1295 domain-containing protein [Cytophagales bacterium]|nr:DUF1295 domain-containing protein [Cytophagales bacterium]